MAKIEMIPSARTAADVKAAQTSSAAGETEFFQILKGSRQGNSNPKAVEKEKSGQSKSAAAEMKSDSKADEQEPVSADTAQLLAMAGLIEEQAQITQREMIIPPEHENAAVMAVEMVPLEGADMPETAAGITDIMNPADISDTMEKTADIQTMPDADGKAADLTANSNQPADTHLPAEHEAVRSLSKQHLGLQETAEMKHKANTEPMAVSDYIKTDDNRETAENSMTWTEEPEMVLDREHSESGNSGSVRREAAETPLYTDGEQINSRPPAMTADVSPQSGTIPVKTTVEELPDHVGTAIAANLPEQNGTLTIELEPAVLGKLTIKVVYEEGRAAVSILSSNPRTLELLSEKAGEMARIIEDKTGQQTMIFTPEQQPEPDGRQGNQEHPGQRQEQEQKESRHQPDSFAQQLRLVLVLKGGFMADIGSISGTSDPYKLGSYNVEPNEKNTMTITSYLKLLAAQLANQDMTNPMDNSEMMAQMTQMAMVQSVTAMTESMQTSTAVTTQTYAAGLVGQEVTVAMTEENHYGQQEPVGVKYGKVESVNLIGGTPMLKLEGDDKEYPLSYVLGMGKIKDPFNKEEGGETETEPDNSQGKVQNSLIAENLRN